MTKVKLGKLWNAQKSISSLVGLDMPIRKGFEGRKMVKAIEEELNIFKDAHKSLVEKYGIKNDKGDYTIPAANEEESLKYGKTINELLEAHQGFGKDMIELNDTEIELSIVEYTEAELDQPGNKLSTSDIILLEEIGIING